MLYVAAELQDGAALYYDRVGPGDLNVARHCLASGWSLERAAAEIGVLRRDLDLALWEDCGVEAVVPLESRWLGNEPPLDGLCG